MIAKAKFDLNKEYFEKYYIDWINTKSKFRKYSSFIGVVLIICGAFIMVIFDWTIYTGIIFITIGVTQLIDSLSYKTRWINKRLKSGISQKAVFEFFDDRLEIKSDNSEGHILLSGINNICLAKNGVFLSPQKDLSYYIPWKSLEPTEEIETVRNLLAKRTKVT